MFEEGEAFINERLNSFSNNYLAYDNSGFFMLNTGNYKKAIQFFKQLLKIENKRFPRILSWMGAAYAHKGETQKSKVLLNELKELKSKSDSGSPAFFIAIIYSALGKKQQALKWLKTAINNREMEIPWLVSEPQLYPLHGMVEFDALVNLAWQKENALDNFLEKIRSIDEITECYIITGEADFLMKIVCKDLPSYEKLLFKTLSQIEEIERIKTLMTLSKVKKDKVLPYDYE